MQEVTDLDNHYVYSPFLQDVRGGLPSIYKNDGERFCLGRG